MPDTLAATRDTLRNAARENDLIITSGGVSVGEEDHIKPSRGSGRAPEPVADRGQAGQTAGLRRSAARRRIGLLPRLAG
ncbi:hypothetical protein LP419_00125 [Massilia sp. H-1]|nr:hypothetical protein LP419_00125 [Massilia sp. H-1]